MPRQPGWGMRILSTGGAGAASRPRLRFVRAEFQAESPKGVVNVVNDGTHDVRHRRVRVGKRRAPLALAALFA